MIVGTLALAAITVCLGGQAARAGFMSQLPADVQNFGILFEGNPNGSAAGTLSIANTNVTGNIGIGNPGPIYSTTTTTAAANAATIQVASVSGLAVGQFVSGAGIPGDTTIAQISGSHTVVLDAGSPITVAANQVLSFSPTSTAVLQMQGTSTLQGNVQFAGAIPDETSDNIAYTTAINGTFSAGNANVQTDLVSLNALSSNLDKEVGAAKTININSANQTLQSAVSTTTAANGSFTNKTSIKVKSTSGVYVGEFVYINNVYQGTITAISGLTVTLSKAVTVANNQTIIFDNLDANGNRVIDLTSVNFDTDLNTLTVVGDGLGNSVVFNINQSAFFQDGTIVLNGLNDDQVLWNVTGGQLCIGGAGSSCTPSTSNTPSLAGDFLDPNGSISVLNAVLNGRIFGGGSDMVVDPSYFMMANWHPPVPEPSSISILLIGLLGLLPFAGRGTRGAKLRGALVGLSRRWHSHWASAS